MRQWTGGPDRVEGVCGMLMRVYCWSLWVVLFVLLDLGSGLFPSPHLMFVLCVLLPHLCFARCRMCRGQGGCKMLFEGEEGYCGEESLFSEERHYATPPRQAHDATLLVTSSEDML